MALAWMLDIGCLQRWQCETFWRTVGDPCDGEPTEKYSNYFRTTTLTGLLDRCYLELGVEIPCQVKRRKWAEGRRPSANAA